MRLSIGERKDWQSILKNHGTKKRHPYDSEDEGEMEEQKIKNIVESEYFFLHNSDTLQGNSGCPLLVRVKTGYCIIGIHIGGFQVYWNGERSIAKFNYARKIPLSPSLGVLCLREKNI